MGIMNKVSVELEMMKEDLEKHDMEVSFNLNGDLRVQWSSADSVTELLYDEGYSEDMFEVEEVHGYVIVKAIVG